MTTLRRLAGTTGGAGFPHIEQGHESGDLPFIKVSDFNHVGNERVITTCNNWVTKETAQRLRATVVPTGSVLLPKVGAALLGNARRIVSQPSVFDNNILGVVPHNINSRYLHYWLTTVDAAQFAKPGPVPSMDDSAVLNLWVPVICQRTQRAIADYLDTHTKRIDTLISKKRRMIQLLEERIRAIRDEWFEDLSSEHGLVSLRRWWSRIEQGWSPVCDSEAAEGKEWGVIKTSAVSSGTFLAENNKTLPAETEPDVRWKLQDGDVLVTRGSGSRAMVGRTCVARVGERNLTLSDLVYRIHFIQACPDYVAAAMSTSPVRTQIEGAIRTDVGQTLKVRRDDLAVVSVPEIPYAQQPAQVSRLAQRISPLKKAGVLIERQLDLLAERRQALITAAVTGELPIRAEGVVTPPLDRERTPLRGRITPTAPVSPLIVEDRR